MVAFVALAKKGLSSLQSAMKQYQKNEKDCERAQTREKVKEERQKKLMAAKNRKERAKNGQILTIDFSKLAGHKELAFVEVGDAKNWAHPWICKALPAEVLPDGSVAKENFDSFVEGFPKSEFYKKGKAVGHANSIPEVNPPKMRELMWQQVCDASTSKAVTLSVDDVMLDHKDNEKQEIWKKMEALLWLHVFQV